MALALYKMKALTLLISLLGTLQASGQFKHYFTYNSTIYKSYFNQKNSPSYFPLNIVVPNVSYKLEHKNLGVEIFRSDGVGAVYHSFKTGGVKPIYVWEGDIIQLDNFSLGLAAHFSLLQRNEIKISLMLGGVKNWYNAMTLEHWVNDNYEAIFGREKQSKFGTISGLNINVPVWKGIYANSNMRYAVFPGAQYNKQNLILDVGIGYLYQHKKKENKK